MCNTNDMVYCGYCQQWYKGGLHACSGMTNYYYCNGCGQYVFGGHICIGTWTGTAYSTPFDEPLKHYKCPRCKGEYSEPAHKPGQYLCPFCGRIMKGLSQ